MAAAGRGGRWDELGQLQFDFLTAQGLKKSDRLLDVGCGSLRGGQHFIRFLDRGCYYGVDRNRDLIDAGLRAEVSKRDQVAKDPRFVTSDGFDFDTFGTPFNFAIAFSVFTHINLNGIRRCLIRMNGVLSPTGRFFATYFDEGDGPGLHPIQQAEDVVTYLDQDPYHYGLAAFEWATIGLDLSVRRTGVDGQHPRNQKMLEFARATPADGESTQLGLPLSSLDRRHGYPPPRGRPQLAPAADERGYFRIAAA